MSDAARIQHVKGSPREIGFALGQALGDRLASNIDRYIQTGPAQHGTLDVDKLQSGALDWLRSLPQRYQDEFEGLATGSSVPLQRLAEWCFVEECVQTGCSALVCTIDGRAWVARNNDLWASDMWGYVTVREVEGRLPTVIFGLEGEVFAGTGISDFLSPLKAGAPALTGGIPRPRPSRARGTLYAEGQSGPGLGLGCSERRSRPEEP